MIKPGDIIKHKTFMDVAIQVVTVNYTPDDKYIFIQGVWYNQGQVTSYSMNLHDDLIIVIEDLGNWLKSAEPRSEFIRNKEWVEL